jgi:hypothetical protein
MNRKPSKLTWAALGVCLATLSLGVVVLSRRHDPAGRGAVLDDDAAGGARTRPEVRPPGSFSAAVRSAPRLAHQAPPPVEHPDPVSAYQARLAARLKAEPPDPGWSSRSAAEVRQRMAQLSVAGLNLLQVECARTVCSLDFKLDAGASLAALKKVAIDFPWPTTGFVTTAEDDPTRVVMYVAREGHALPQYQ